MKDLTKEKIAIKLVKLMNLEHGGRDCISILKRLTKQDLNYLYIVVNYQKHFLQLDHL